jgi:hypothetical protein
MEVIDYSFDDIHVGQTASFDRTVSVMDVDTFADLSGDKNPLHTDDTYASTTQFKQRVVHGMLTASFFSTLVGMYSSKRFWYTEIMKTRTSFTKMFARQAVMPQRICFERHLIDAAINVQNKADQLAPIRVVIAELVQDMSSSRFAGVAPRSGFSHSACNESIRMNLDNKSVWIQGYCTLGFRSCADAHTWFTSWSWR